MFKIFIFGSGCKLSHITPKGLSLSRRKNPKINEIFHGPLSSSFFVFIRIISLNTYLKKLGPVVPFYGELKSPHLARIFVANRPIMTYCRKMSKRAIV